MRAKAGWIFLVFVWSCLAGAAYADGDFDQTKFDRLAADLDSDRFAARQEAQKQLSTAATKTGMAGGLTFAQLATVQGLIFTGASLEVKRRAETIMQSLVGTLPAASMIRDALEVVNNPATGFIRVDGAEGKFDPKDATAKATAAALQRKWFAILSNLGAGNYDGAVAAYNDYVAFIKNTLKPADFAKLNLKKNNADFTTAELRAQTVDADRGFGDLKGQIQNKGANPNPGAGLAVPVPNGNGLVLIPDQPNQSLRLAIPGTVVAAGGLTVFGPTAENALSLPPPGYEYVGEIFDLGADDALLVSGEIRIGIEYGELQAIGNPVLDPTKLRLVRVANDEIEFLDQAANNPLNDLGGAVLFASYFANSADVGRDQFGEFAIVQAVAEPPAIGLFSLGAVAALSVFRRRRNRVGSQARARQPGGRRRLDRAL